MDKTLADFILEQLPKNNPGRVFSKWPWRCDISTALQYAKDYAYPEKGTVNKTSWFSDQAQGVTLFIKPREHMIKPIVIELSWNQPRKEI